MRKVFLYMTMTFDGFFSGPNDELDWMVQTPDQELNDDIVALLKSADAGLMGFPTASGMIPYWANELGRTVLHARQISTRGGELFCNLLGDRVQIAGHAALFLKGQIQI